MRLSLEWTEGDAPVRTTRLTAVPLRVGRGLDNDVVIAHSDVSGHHAVVARVGDDAVLTDLRSTNGTTVNGAPVTRARVLEDGDIVGFGEAVFAVVRLSPGPDAGAPLYVEDRGLVHRVEGDTLALPDLALRFVARGDGFVCEGPEGPVEVALDAPFTVGGRVLRLRRPGPAETTRRSPRGAFPYRVEASLGAEGAVARFVDRADGRAHVLQAETRAVLVWILGRRLLEDRARGAPEPGWCADAEVRVGIWGAEAREQLENNLNVVVSRVRRELGERGFDGRCIDRRRGGTRLVVAEVQVG
ncbi:MAG: FHA domain-containing protein [Myxococcota bacterium]